MKAVVILFVSFLTVALHAGSQDLTQKSNDSTLKVILLGTRSGPAIDADRKSVV